MNDRLIKELRRQAIEHCLDKGSQGNLSEEVSEKFAELIVKECATVYRENVKADMPLYPTEFSKALREHFGIKV